MARYGLWAPIPEWVGGTRKWGRGRNGRRITAVVIHRMDGSLEGSDAWLRRQYDQFGNRLNASTHFAVGLWNGVPQIRQWVDTANSAFGWSARPTDTPTPLAVRTLTNLYSGSEDLNWQVISVEVEGWSTQAWDSRTRDKVKELLRWIYKAHGNLVVMAHTDISWKPCPGMTTFKAALPGYYGTRLGTIFGGVPDTSTGTTGMEGFPVRFRPMYGKTIRMAGGVNVRRGTATVEGKPTSTIHYTTKTTTDRKILGMTLGGSIGGKRGWYVWWSPNEGTTDTWDGRLVYVHENYARVL